MGCFKFACPHCGGHIEAEMSMQGDVVECPHCGKGIVVPHVKFRVPCARPRRPLQLRRSQDVAGHVGIGSSESLEMTSADGFPYATLLLVLMSVAVYAVLVWWTGSLDPDSAAYVANGANFRRLTFGGDVWRLITSSFLHIGPKHLVVNMICLWTIGKSLERLVGHGTVFAVYFLTACAGGVLSCVVHGNTVCAGASGAIFGLFGATVSYLLLNGERAGFSRTDLVGYLKGSLVFCVVNLGVSLLPGIDMAGHVGGLAAGLALGGLMSFAENFRSSKGRAIEIGLMCACLLLEGIMLVTVVKVKEAGWFSSRELAREVKNLIEEKMPQQLQSTGVSDASVEVEMINLSREAPSSIFYLGSVVLNIHANGDDYHFDSGVSVRYDGDEYEYACELKDLDRLSIRLTEEELAEEVAENLKVKLTRDLRSEIQGEGDVVIVIERIKLRRHWEDRDLYTGTVRISVKEGDKTEVYEASIKVTYDGTTFSYELQHVHQALN